MFTRLLTVLVITFCFFSCVQAATITELPKEYFGTYKGEPENVVAEARARNMKVLPYKANKITLKSGRTVEWKYIDAITNMPYSYSGYYTVSKESPESYSLDCTLIFKEKTWQYTIKFKFLVLKSGDKGVYIQPETGRSFEVKK